MVTVSVTCPAPIIADRSLSVTMPGGLSLSVQLPRVNLDNVNLELSSQLLSQITTALAPLEPLFNLIDAVVAIKDFASGDAEAVARIVEAVAKLAQIVPALSIPIMLLDILDVLITNIDGIISELTDLIDYEAQIEAVSALATELGNAALQAAATCAQTVLLGRRENLDAMLASLGPVITMLNNLLSMIGVSAMDAISADHDDPNDAIEALEDAQKTLRAIQQALPT
jgi:hypothetical protein